MRFNPARGADKGAISQQTSPLPSGSLSHPPPIQDPVAPPKRVTVGRMAALRLRLRPCPTPASKKQIQPGSRCLQGGDLTSNLATAHCLSLFNPSPTQDPVNAPSKSLPAAQQRCGSVFVHAQHFQERISFTPARVADKGALTAEVGAFTTAKLASKPTEAEEAVKKGHTMPRAPRLNYYVLLTPDNSPYLQFSRGKAALPLRPNRLSTASRTPPSPTWCLRRRSFANCTISLSSGSSL
jgi:hypothetical protein